MAEKDKRKTLVVTLQPNLMNILQTSSYAAIGTEGKSRLQTTSLASGGAKLNVSYSSAEQ